MGLLLRETGDLITWDMENTEVLNNILTQSSPTSAIAILPESHNPAPSTVVQDQDWDHVRNLNLHGSMGPDQIHLRVLRNLVDRVDKPLSITFKKLWQFNEVLIYRKRGNITSIFKRGKRKTPRTTGQVVSPPFPGKSWTRPCRKPY